VNKLGRKMVDQPAAGKPSQHPDAHLFCDGGDGLRCQFSAGAKAHGLRDSTRILDRLEAPVDDAAMVMNMAVKGGTEAVDKADRPEARMRAGAAAPAQMGLDDAQQDMQHGADGLRLAAPDTKRSRLGTERTHWRTGNGGMT
jgi:hypothetical protein